MVSLEYFIDTILPAELWCWGESASNRNEYQEFCLVASTSWNPQGLSRLVMELLYLCSQQRLIQDSNSNLREFRTLHLSSSPTLPLSPYYDQIDFLLLLNDIT
jgi:hypothetical protein